MYGVRMYAVHVKRVIATEARKNWFRILDEVLAGEVVSIHRKGRRIVLRVEEAEGVGWDPAPDYADLLRVEDGDRADEWGWEWTEGGDLSPVPGEEA